MRERGKVRRLKQKVKLAGEDRDLDFSILGRRNTKAWNESEMGFDGKEKKKRVNDECQSEKIG